MHGAPSFLAFDLGAESGRALLGSLENERFGLKEVHRFPNVPVRVKDGLHWDVLRIWHEIREGLARGVEESAGGIESAGVDSWGVDFGLLDRQGALVSNPCHHRDARTRGMLERACKLVSKDRIYETTGIQFMPINTLDQLMAMQGSPLLEIADTMLLIPDLMGYWLTGEIAGELTIATTTQLFDVRARDWARSLIDDLGLPVHIFPGVTTPGSELGSLLPGLSKEAGLRSTISVTSVASHDTACAVAAVPADQNNFAYISSGTWSLVGVEVKQPIITELAMRSNFTNEGGFEDTIRFLKNVMGLWLLQESRRTWAQKGARYTYDELVELATEAPAFGPLVDPDDEEFLAPGDMPARLAAFCRGTHQEPAEEPGAVVRCVLESLALKYRWVIDHVEEVTGRDIEVIHVVGGGSRNELLCSLTADATRRPVRAGPAEATALGNVMIQAHARGHLASLADMREVVRRSVEVRTYEPSDEQDRWAYAYERFCSILDD